MTQQHPTSRTKAWVAIVLLVTLGSICIAAAQWQLRRAHTREAIHAARLAGQQAAPLVLSASQTDGPDWHRATVRGHWLNPLTVLLDNRNLKGRPGFWVATPLALQDAAQTVVLVLRGWLPRPMPPAKLPLLYATEGLVTINGTLLHHIPRLLDLGVFTGTPDNTLPQPFPPADGTVPALQNLSLDAFAKATSLTVLPVIIQQSPTKDAGLIQEWPGPSENAGQNYNYALQWSSFAAIALIAAAITLWRTLRRKSLSTSDDSLS